jgi:hypothetical protein
MQPSVNIAREKASPRQCSNRATYAVAAAFQVPILTSLSDGKIPPSATPAAGLRGEIVMANQQMQNQDNKKQGA